MLDIGAQLGQAGGSECGAGPTQGVGDACQRGQVALVLERPHSNNARSAFFEEEPDQLMKVVGTQISQWPNLLIVDWPWACLGGLEINTP
jgi:hypothetical protein